jgi:16S rRNA (cytosine967-C5)-methyltransferase
VNTPSLPLARLLNHSADAVQAVRAGHSLNAALARCPAEARPGTQALSFQVLRRMGSAEAARALLAAKTPPPAADALLLSALALLWPTGEAPPYPEHTLVDQAVTAAQNRPKSNAPFVNAVLRRFLRERDSIVETALRDPVARWNHPRWWIERLQHDWPERWQAILAANNRHPPMTLRVNIRRVSVDGYLARLADAGIAAHAVGPCAIDLDAPVPVTRLPGFADGDVSVQDAAAQLAAPLLITAGDPAGPQTDRPDPSTGSGQGTPHGVSKDARKAHVLDACAAPGGKTAHLLELADLDLLALDSDAARLQRMHGTLQRLHLHARTLAADAADPARWWDGRRFDAILLDAPCTASGIVRRHPDVRWLRRPGDIAALAATQARLLDALWPTLAPGGRLLYCTCSVFKAEGEQQIDAFLQRRRDASIAAHPPSPGHMLPLPDNSGEAGPAGAVPPGGPSPDGFFYALLQKT